VLSENSGSKEVQRVEHKISKVKLTTPKIRRIQGIKMNTMVTSVTPLVPLLEGSSNYESWARDVKMLLIGEDLWDHVDMEPAIDTAVSGKKAAQKAMAKIYMLLGPGAKMEVTECETAKEMWDQLKKTYENKGLNRQVALLNELFDLHLQNCRDMEEYILKFTIIDAKLKSIDKRMDDQILAVLMLRGLTPDYRPFRMALENTMPTSAKGEQVTLSMEIVKARLLEEGRTSILYKRGLQKLRWKMRLGKE
jgi:hypothetical protein